MKVISVKVVALLIIVSINMVVFYGNLGCLNSFAEEKPNYYNSGEWEIKQQLDKIESSLHKIYSMITDFHLDRYGVKRYEEVTHFGEKLEEKNEKLYKCPSCGKNFHINTWHDYCGDTYRIR